MARNTVFTSGDLILSKSKGRTVYKSDRDIYVNGKNVGKTTAAPTEKQSRGSASAKGSRASDADQGKATKFVYVNGRQIRR
jgi:hypothetical protein